MSQGQVLTTSSLDATATHERRHWWSWSGSNRRPPECKSGALPVELQPLKENQSRPVGCRDSGNPVPCRFRNSSRISPSGDSETGSSVRLVPTTLLYGQVLLDRRFGVERLFSTRSRCTLKRFSLSKTPPTFSLRKEVIQPQVLLRLPCYDFTPIMDHTLGRCPPCGSACRLLVQFTFVM